MAQVPKAISSQEFYEAMLHPLERTQDQPTYPWLAHATEALSNNAAEVSCTLGGGNHGYLGLVVRPAVYQTLSPTPFVIPDVPNGPNIPNNPTAAQIAEANRQYVDTLRIIQEARNFDKALLRKLLEAIPSIYIDGLRRPRLGLLGQTTRDVLDYLSTNYGVITDADKVANKKRLDEPYNPVTEPFPILVNRYVDIQTLAADADQPISDAELISSAKVLLENSGVLEPAIREWENKPVNDRNTFVQFCDFFRREISRFQNKRGAGRLTGQAHHTGQEIQTPSDAEVHQQLMETQILAQQQAFATLAETQKAAFAELLQPLQNLISTLSVNNGQPPPNRRRRPPSYCHTHGYAVARNHNSANCNNPGPNHNRAATYEDNMGGSQRGKPQE